MGIQNELNVIRNCRKSLLHLTILTSIVAAGVATATLDPSNHQPHIISSTDPPQLPPPPPPQQEHQTAEEETMLSQSNTNGQIIDRHHLRPAIPFCNDKQERTIGRR